VVERKISTIEVGLNPLDDGKSGPKYETQSLHMSHAKCNSRFEERGQLEKRHSPWVVETEIKSIA
jgi:hypothetical protein